MNPIALLIDSRTGKPSRRQKLFSRDLPHMLRPLPREVRPRYAPKPYTSAELNGTTYTRDAAGTWWCGVPSQGARVLSPRVIRRLRRRS